MKFVWKIWVLYLLLAPTGVFAQKLPDVKKGKYVDTLNRYYHQLDLPAFLHISTSPDSTPTTLSTKDFSDKQNPTLPFYFSGHGKHTIHYFGNEKTKRVVADFVVYVDGKAPKSISYFKNAPRYSNGKTQFYGQGLVVAIASADDMSGVQNTFVSTNFSDFSLYEGDKSMEEEGEYTLQYLATDKVGNMERPVKRVFTVDLSSPETFHHIIGIADKSIISSATKIYLTAEDNLSGVNRTYYSIDGGPRILYKDGSLIPTSKLSDGEHSLKYYSIDNVSNVEESKTFDFYLDKTSPIMTADILGDRFIVNDKIYFSGRTKLKLTAVDNKSGVKEVLYSIDNEPYKKYEDPFYMPSKAGLHNIRYFGLDNMTNQGTGSKKNYDEYQHNSSVVYVDLTGPSLSHQFIGPKFKKGSNIFINNKTQVKLSAIDPESGMQKITYSLDGGKTEILYKDLLTFDTEGADEIDFYGYDNVNNRNVSIFKFMVDNSGPQIFYHFSVEPNQDEDQNDVYPSYTSLSLAASDGKTGSQGLFYSINGGVEKPYTGVIAGFVKNKSYKINIRAVDKLGNESTEEIVFKTDKY